MNIEFIQRCNWGQPEKSWSDQVPSPLANTCITSACREEQSPTNYLNFMVRAITLRSLHLHLNLHLWHDVCLIKNLWNDILEQNNEWKNSSMHWISEWYQLNINYTRCLLVVCWGQLLWLPSHKCSMKVSSILTDDSFLSVFLSSTLRCCSFWCTGTTTPSCKCILETLFEKPMGSQIKQIFIKIKLCASTRKQWMLNQSKRDDWQFILVCLD